MNLIQILAKDKKGKSVGYQRDSLLSIFQSHIEGRTLINSTKQIEFLFTQNQFKGYDIVLKITINEQTQCITIKSSILSYKLFRAQEQYQRTIILRSILKIIIRCGIESYKYNPVSGELALQSKFFLKKIQKKEQLIPVIMCCVQKANLFKFQQFNKIICFLAKKSFELNDLNKQNQKLRQIKRYIMSSTDYTWFLMTNSTKNSKNSNQFFVYKQTKLKYQTRDRNYNENLKIKAFSEVLDSVQKIPDLSIISRQQDEDLKKRYLQKIALTTKNKKQLSQITIPEQFFKDIICPIDCKVNCYEVKGGINVAIRKAKKILSRKYERAILLKLPQNQFLNLVKYYVVKNNPDFNEKWEITNLYQSLQIQTYVQNNKQTISIFTKLAFLHQVSVALKYLRDINIVYHNLIPQNVFIKKGLMIKISDLSNAYHSGIFSLFQQQHIANLPPINKFPFVQNVLTGKNKTVDDQRSDVYSFGIFLFWLLNKKDYANIKKSRVIQLTDDQKIKKLEKGSISSFENIKKFNHKLLRILCYFCMKCTQYQRIEYMGSLNDMFQSSSSNQQQQNEESYIQVQNRPYLDWVVLVIKCIFNEFQKNIF